MGDDAKPRIRLRIVGDASIAIGDRELSPSAPHLFAFVLRLSADPDRRFQRAEIARLLFPTAPSDAAAAHSVRQIIYKATTWSVPLIKVGEAVAIGSGDVDVDIDDEVDRDQSVVGAQFRTLSVLPGYAPALSVEFAHWLDVYRDHQEARLKGRLLMAVGTLRRRAEWGTMECRARECLALDPLNEPATLALAEAFARTGSKERAVATLESYRHQVGSLDPNIAVPASLLKKRIETSPAAYEATGHAPLVGRGEHMTQLNDQWLRVRHGQLQCAVVRGEPGSGKSRFLDEFVALVALGGNAHTIVIRGSVHESFRPLSFISALARRLLQLPGAAGRDPDLEIFLRRVTQSGEDDAASLAPGEAHFINAGINRAIVDLLDSVCSERPCVLVVDDSRALDDSSLAVLAGARHSAPQLRLHIVIVKAENEPRNCTDQLDAQTVSLGPLDATSSRTLLASFASPHGARLDENTMEWCSAIAAGNPAFLHLLAAHCSSGGVRRDIPMDVMAAVERRLEHLSPNALHVLTACAVLGDHCDGLLLSEVLGLPTLSLIASLDELERGTLIQSSEERVVVRSALVRECVLNSASPSVLCLLHCRAAAVLTERPSSPDSHWRIASHWRSGGQHQRAHAEMQLSWRRSVQLGQPRQAELSIREHISRSFESRERVSLYDDLIEVTKASGHVQAMISAIDERADLLRTLGMIDTRTEALSLDRLDGLLTDHGNPAAAQQDLLRFVRLRSLDPTRRIRAALWLTIGADANADRSIAELANAELSDIPAKDASSQGYLRQCRLVFHSVFGEKAIARDIAHELMEAQDSERHSWHHIHGLLNASLAIQLTSDASTAFRILEDCYRLVSDVGSQQSSVFVASRLASFWLDDGDVQTASRWALRAHAHAMESQDARLPSDYLSVHADLAMLAGDFDAARALLATMRASVPLYESPRFRMGWLTYSLRLSQFAGLPCDAGDVDRLLQWHHEAREYGRHDDEMDALWVALHAQGRGNLARTLLADYLMIYRRESRPCRYMLRTRTSADPARELVALKHSPGMDAASLRPRAIPTRLG